MPNYDESILRARRIVGAAPFPALHQALRIALYDEYAARAFYAKVIEAFGAQAPFARIVAAESQHIAALAALCERYGVPRPLDPFPTETTVAPSWRINCERAVAGELANIELYERLLPAVTASDVRKTFLRLQSASLQRHLPAFQHAASLAAARENYHAARGVAPSEAYARHGPVSDFVERTLALLGRQHGAFGFVGPVLKAAHPALLAGLAGGSAAVVLARKKSSSHS